MNEPDIFFPADLCQLVREKCVDGNTLQGVLCGRKLLYDADAVDNYIRMYFIDCALYRLYFTCTDIPENLHSRKERMSREDRCIPAHGSGNRMFPREHLHQFMAEHSGGAEYQNGLF